MDNLGFLGLAFVVVWLGIAIYLLTVTRRQRALEERLEELEKRNNPD
ncbi:MAG TPA: CcmD family protein [Actinomycetota bacterium]|nr:CcmD family protein [Actinomycetota bacterium]